MKRYDIFLRRRLTKGAFTIYSLPRRSSAYGIARLVVGCNVRNTVAKARLSGGNAISLGLSKAVSLKDTYGQIASELGLRAKGSVSTEVSAGNVEESTGIGCSCVETGKEIFLSCSFVICSGVHADKSGKENTIHTQPLGISIPNMETAVAKEGNLSATESVVISTAPMDAKVYNAVGVKPKKELSSALVLEGNAVAGHWSQLNDFDQETLSSLDFSSINELGFIEEG